jgi:hypothetical protein
MSCMQNDQYDNRYILSATDQFDNMSCLQVMYLFDNMSCLQLICSAKCRDCNLSVGKMSGLQLICRQYVVTAI